MGLVRYRLPVVILAPLALSLFIVASLAEPPRAHAFRLGSDCVLAAISFRSDDSLLDSVVSGADDSSQTDPFQVDWAGQVHWVGRTTSTITNNSWHVDVFMLPTPLRGGDANPRSNKIGDGDIDVGANVPFRFTGLYYVSGEFSGDGGSCAGSGWVRLIGNPLASVPFWIAVLVALVGLVALIVAWRTAGWGWALLGGVLAGVGLAVVFISLAVVPLGQWTPLGTLGAFVLIGVLVALIAARNAPRGF
jgi:hypothetical protein